MIDELTGQAPAGPSLIRTPLKNVGARMGADSIGGIIGTPRAVFPALNAQPYTVHLSVVSEGYLTQEIDVAVPQDLSFPNTFSPPPLIDVFLHRKPTIIRGRTIRANSTTTIPVPGATVRVTGIWRTPPAANASVPPSAPNVVSLRPPLYADRKAVVGHLGRRNLTALAGSKFLLADVLQGATEMRLSDQVGLAVGTILLIDASEPDLIEFMVIKSITGAGTADQPCTASLAQPLAYEHRRNAVVLRANPSAPAPAKQISVEALAGDTCVFLSSTGGLTAEVEVSGGSANEYHGVSTFSVASDSDGYYRLPPLSRVAQLVIEGKKTVGPQTFAAKTEFRPDYSKWENTLDLLLSV
ncbi:MAG: hypothetical protein ACJ74G_20865 [Blastocatellia bacterium]